VDGVGTILPPFVKVDHASSHLSHFSSTRYPLSRRVWTDAPTIVTRRPAQAGKSLDLKENRLYDFQPQLVGTRLGLERKPQAGTEFNLVA